MIYSRRDQFEQIKMKKLKDANPARYNYEMCLLIQRAVNKIELPRLSRDEMSHLKEHLEEYQKINSEDLRYKFLNLRNSFLLINEFEERAELQKRIRPITHYLDEFKYVFDLILESQSKKDSPMLDKAIIILDVPINKFCMLYANILSEVAPNALQYQPVEIPREEIPDYQPAEQEEADHTDNYKQEQPEEPDETNLEDLIYDEPREQNGDDEE